MGVAGAFTRVAEEVGARLQPPPMAVMVAIKISNVLRLYMSEVPFTAIYFCRGDAVASSRSSSADW